MATATVNREAFLRTLAQVEPGLSQRDIIEQSACFILLEGYVWSYNDEIACKCRSGLPPEFTGAVPHKPLLDQLQKWTDDEVTLTLGDGELLIAGKRRKSGIRMEKDIALPLDAIERPKKAAWQPLHAEFAEAVGVVGQCAGRDESKFSSTCVHVSPKWVEACDDIQLCRWLLPTGFAGSVLMRQASVKHVQQLAMTEFAETDNWVHFRNPARLTLSCRRYLEEYPDLTKYLDRKGAPASLPKGLAEAADRAAVFTAEVPEGNYVNVRLGGGKVRVRGEGVAGWFEERRTVTYNGEPLEFYIAPSMLEQVVKRHNEVEVSATHMRVVSSKWTWYTALANPATAAKNGDGNGKAEEEGGE